MAFYVQSFVCVPSLSSPLLLRISPHTSALISILPMCLSSRNRSNSNAFRLILPCLAPFCEGMHYHKTGVPWQINKTLIIIFLLLKCLVFPYFTYFFGFFQKLQFSGNCNKSGKIRQFETKCSSL